VKPVPFVSASNKWCAGQEIAEIQVKTAGHVVGGQTGGIAEKTTNCPLELTAGLSEIELDGTSLLVSQLTSVAVAVWASRDK